MAIIPTYLLLEDGRYLLLEDGRKIVIDETEVAETDEGIVYSGGSSSAILGPVSFMSVRHPISTSRVYNTKDGDD